jgi:hypothetical protein
MSPPTKCILVLAGSICCSSIWMAPLHSAEWEIVLTLHEAYSITNDDGGGFGNNDDMVMKVKSGPATYETDEDGAYDEKLWGPEGQRDLFPEWKAPIRVSGPNPQVELVLALWDADSGFNGSDDHLDINPRGGSIYDIFLDFKPASQEIKIDGKHTKFECSGGRYTFRGDEGDDHARVVFSVSASAVGPEGDWDDDGLLDSWETCGLDANYYGIMDVDLPGMG